MKNLVQPGRTITVTAPANVESGEGVLIGQLFGVAAGDADNGESLDLVTEGVFDLAKNSASVFTVGAPVYFNPTDGNAHSNADEDSNSGGTVQIGVAVAAAGAGAATVRVRLTQPAVAV
jgi:predicted RecA/RadA family phage recombinase